MLIHYVKPLIIVRAIFETARPMYSFTFMQKAAHVCWQHMRILLELCTFESTQICYNLGEDYEQEIVCRGSYDYPNHRRVYGNTLTFQSGIFTRASKEGI
jgi:hypothetical protein